MVNELNDAIEKVKSGDWIYFTKRAYGTWNGGDLYKIRTDGTELTLLCCGLCAELKIKGGELHYTEYENNDCYEGYTVEYKKNRCSIPLY